MIFSADLWFPICTLRKAAGEGKPALQVLGRHCNGIVPTFGSWIHCEGQRAPSDINPVLVTIENPLKITLSGQPFTDHLSLPKPNDRQTTSEPEGAVTGPSGNMRTKGGGIVGSEQMSDASDQEREEKPNEQLSRNDMTTTTTHDDIVLCFLSDGPGC